MIRSLRLIATVIAPLCLLFVTGFCHGQIHVSTFLPWNPSSFTQSGIGNAFQLNEHFLVVARPFEDTGLNARSGVVAVHSPETYELLFEIPNPRPAIWDQFGTAISLSGNRLVVGAEHRANLTTPTEGIVYVFDLGSANPDIPAMTIENPSPSPRDLFGGELALDDNLLAVAKLQPGVPGPEVLIFDLESSTPEQPETVIGDPLHDLSAEFGASLDMEDGWLFCGARRGAFTGTSSGIAFAFDLNASEPHVPALTFRRPDSFDRNFGESIAVDGDYLVISAPAHFSNNGGFGIAYLYSLISSEPTVPIGSFQSGSSQNFFNFGQSISISDSNCVIGELGGAYLYELNPEGTLSPLHTFVDPLDVYGDYFGQSVYVFDRKVLVGDPRRGTQSSGHVHVYDTGSKEPQTASAIISPASAIGADAFGGAVAAANGRFIVGASRDDSGAQESGAAYIFDISDGIPGRSVFLSCPQPQFNAEFGRSVAIDDNIAVVGTSGTAPGATNAYAFDLASGDPETPIVTFKHPDSPNISIGRAVAISQKTVAVSTAADAGEVFFFDLDAPDPTLNFHRIANPQQDGRDFGHSLVFQSADIVIAGAPGNRIDGNPSGVVYLYDLAQDGSVPARAIEMPGAQQGAEFGNAIAVQGNLLVVGAPGWDDSATDSGVVFIIDLSAEDPGVPMYTISNPLPSVGSRFGSSVAMEGSTVVVGAPFANGSSINDGIAYVYDIASADPAVPVRTIQNPSPDFEDAFGVSVAIVESQILVGADTDGTAASHAGAVHLFADGPVNHTPVDYSVSRGSLDRGEIVDLHSANQVSVAVSRNPLDVQSVVEFSFSTSSANFAPESLQFKIVSRVNSKPAITRRLELFDYDASDWVIVDTGIANNTGFSSVVVAATGDLSRFVEPVSGAMEARVRFSASSNRARFAALIDQVQWIIE
ncbi:MAG: hypothetical protein AAF456_22190 [Planctomycetota bacterium]